MIIIIIIMKKYFICKNLAQFESNIDMEFGKFGPCSDLFFGHLGP